MEEFRYDSYCGLYCGACDVMSVYRKALDAGVTATWEDVPADLRKNVPAPKDRTVVCYGCKTDSVFSGCSRCFIRKCAKNKMRVETCFDCSRFPCVRFRIFGAVRKLLQRRLPHIRSAQVNQTCIRQKGMAAWLIEQDSQWKCPECGAPFTWYRKTCESCGSDLGFPERFSRAGS